MKIAFTICSNNYLAQAKTLGDSLLKHNKVYQFVIGLVDTYSPEIDYTAFADFELIPIEKLDNLPLQEMLDKYNIVELNTAVKPYLFDFLFRTKPEIADIIYLDPDIRIYQPLTILEDHFNHYDILITPHFTTPIYDKFYTNESDILRTGLYNLGFIGVKKSEEASKFINWWMIKLKDYCFDDPQHGMFTDQLPINFVPLYFKNVLILTHKGHNMAYWNLHERQLAIYDSVYKVNSTELLVFFHFSGFQLAEPDVLSKYQTRYTFQSRPDITDIFKEYYNSVVESKYFDYINIPCFYIQAGKRYREELKNRKKSKSFKGRLKQKFMSLIGKSKS